MEINRITIFYKTLSTNKNPLQLIIIARTLNLLEYYSIYVFFSFRLLWIFVFFSFFYVPSRLFLLLLHLDNFNQFSQNQLCIPEKESRKECAKSLDSYIKKFWKKEMVKKRNKKNHKGWRKRKLCCAAPNLFAHLYQRQSLLLQSQRFCLCQCTPHIFK